MVELPPGAWSTNRHWHRNNDELVIVISGELVAVTDEGEEVLRAGDCIGFKAGCPMRTTCRTAATSQRSLRRRRARAWTSRPSPTSGWRRAATWKSASPRSPRNDRRSVARLFAPRRRAGRRGDVAVPGYPDNRVVPTRCAIRDARDAGTSLEREGFELVQHRSAHVGERDKAKLAQDYHAEMAGFLQDDFGASTVIPSGGSALLVRYGARLVGRHASSGRPTSSTTAFRRASPMSTTTPKSRSLRPATCAGRSSMRGS